MRKRVRAYVWLIREVGIRRTVQYEKVRRSGLLLNWADVLSLEEMALMEEHFENLPWKGTKISRPKPRTGTRRSVRRGEIDDR